MHHMRSASEDSVIRGVCLTASSRWFEELHALGLAEAVGLMFFSACIWSIRLGSRCMQHLSNSSFASHGERELSGHYRRSIERLTNEARK